MSHPAIVPADRPNPSALAVKILGIPLECDRKRLESVLADRVKEAHHEKLNLDFNKAVNVDRRIHVEITGASDTLVGWLGKMVREALCECSYPHHKIVAIIADS
jgi:hypothetical protein